MVIPKPGDIGMYSADGVRPHVDWIIQRASFKTHCSFFIDPERMIEANRHGVRIERYNPNLKHIHVYRAPEGLLTIDQIRFATELAHIHLGDKYSVIQGVIAGLCEIFGLTDWAESIDRNWNCSEFLGYLIHYGLHQHSIRNKKSLRLLLPDHIEQWLIENNWERVI